MSLKSGRNHVCALTEEGDLYCWGANGYGALGAGPLTSSPVLRKVEGTFDLFDTGPFGTCARSGDTLLCWGWNAIRQISAQESDIISAPTPVDLDFVATDVAMGAHHICVLDEAGQAHCWGNNGLGSLGDNSAVEYLTPHRVER